MFLLEITLSVAIAFFRVFMLTIASALAHYTFLIINSNPTDNNVP